MGEEKKQKQGATEAKAEKKNNLGALAKIICGVIFLILGIAALIVWRDDFFSLIKASIGPILVLAGIITIAIAKD